MEALSTFLVAVGEAIAGLLGPLFPVLGVLFSGLALAVFIPVLQQDDSFKQIRNWAR